MPVNLEEELLEQQQEEEERAQALEEQKQLERMQAQSEAEEEETPASQAREAAKNFVKDQAKRVVKSAAKKAIKTTIVETAPVWGPIAGIIAGIILILALGLVVIISVTSSCNAGGVSGFAAKVASKALPNILPGSVFPQLDVCKYLAADTSTVPNVPAAPTTAPNEKGLVHLSDYGIPVKSGVDDRVTQCMASKVFAIYSLAQGTQPPIDFEISSAYRPGSTTAGGGVSAHSRGEAADIALRNPTVPVHGNDPRIAQLISIAQSVGFVPKAGDTLNEYANPAENATGGHIHVEFNIPPNGGSYCDGTAS